MRRIMDKDKFLTWLLGPDGEREWDSDTLPEMVELINAGAFDVEDD